MKLVFILWVGFVALIVLLGFVLGWFLAHSVPKLIVGEI